MPRETPIREIHETAGALWGSYGPPGRSIAVVQAFESVGLEYAALRKGCVILDHPQRATVEVTGTPRDRADLLQRMVTQDLKGMDRGASRRAFWLSRKGRIDADVRLAETGERMLVDVDAFAAGRFVDGLTEFVFSEDVRFEDASARWHRFSLHGPRAAAVLGGVELADGRCELLGISGVDVLVERWDSAGVPGFELTVPAAHARDVYLSLADTSPPPDRGARPALMRPTDAAGATPPRATRAGWHAYNIARLEAGTALYMVDFGPDCLPAETGDETLRDRVSFTKGCYLGQEIVARMQSLGHPKQRLVALRIEGGETAQPESGAPVLARRTDLPEQADIVGAVTSSTLSPMLGNQPIALAMVRWSHAQTDAEVWVSAEGGVFAARVSATLRLAPRARPSE